MNKNGNPFLILLIATVIIAAISLLPLESLSGGKLRDFSLISDLFKGDSTPETIKAETYLDPDLETVLAEVEAEGVSNENIPDSAPGNEPTKEPSGTAPSGPSSGTREVRPPVDAEPGIIEDYTPDQKGLSHLRSAIEHSSGKPARIAIIGDSYIEGDILSEVVRENLQSRYGGKGAGYVPLSSNITGFRNSIRQECSNWKEYDFRTNGKDCAMLQGFYFTPDGDATTTVRGSKKETTTSSWELSRLLVMSPGNSRITFYTGSGEPSVKDVTGSADVQCLALQGNTSKVSVSCSDPSVRFLGLYLDGDRGVALDNMSIRGYAGIKHTNLKTDIALQAKPYINYDLIILEYGINALTAEQTDYRSYTKVLGRSIDHIRQAYPEADILLMGIGDRGVKHDGEIISMPTVRNMIEAQRNLAREKGLLFWDTCKAMGGQGAVVEWVRTKDINKDYIHLSRKGGARLGKLFSEALENMIDE